MFKALARGEYDFAICPAKVGDELQVKDDGICKTKEFVEKIYEAFERERTSAVSGIQGTGSGMAVTKGIIDMMQGTIKDVLS
ncbi:MAG: ATP-binding protein [Lachnospiraceae bacterium]|nr:ATP-binding protein [Lachnospiraceae bacterium]